MSTLDQSEKTVEHAVLLANVCFQDLRYKDEFYEEVLKQVCELCEVDIAEVQQRLFDEVTTCLPTHCNKF